MSLSFCWFAVSVHNRNPFYFACLLAGLAIESIGEEPFKKFKRVTIARGEFSLTLDHS